MKAIYTTLFQDCSTIHKMVLNYHKNEKERKEQERKSSEEEKSFEEKNQKFFHDFEEGEDVTSQKTFEPPKKRYLKQQAQLERLHIVPFHMTLRSAVKQYIT